MNNKYVKIYLTLIAWAISAFIMSMVYYKFKEMGLIWDNPDYIIRPDGSYFYQETWNTRKLIFGFIGLSSFILTIIRCVDITTNGEGLL